MTPVRTPSTLTIAGTPATPDDARRWVAYDFAVLRVVAHPHVGAFVSVGVVLHARTAEFLGMRVLCDPVELARRIPDVDAELLSRYLEAARAICEGDESHGPVALTPPSERFHWLTAPRSDVIQASAVHEGVCEDPARELERLYGMYVGV
jgi:hypothetical protein